MQSRRSAGRKKAPGRAGAWRRLGRAALAAVALFGGVAVQPAAAERPLTFQGVRLSGSERLALFGLTRPGQPPAARRLARGIAAGMGHEAGFGTVVRQSVDIDPILRYDDNLNGGLRNDSFTLFGLEFVVDEAQVAQAGLLLGAGARSATRVALGGRSALVTDLDLWGGVAPGTGLTKAGTGGRACLTRRVDFANHLRGCGGASIERFDLGESEAVFADADWFRLFGLGPSLHEARLGIGTTRFDADDGPYDQAAWSAGLVSAWPAGVATAFDLRRGEAVPGQHVVTTALSAELTALVASRPTRFRLGWRQSEGGLFFGTPRTDETWRVALSRPLGARLAVSAGYEVTQSSVDFFEDEDFDLSVQIDF
ncbi:hypothetical protein [Limimaricola pyoseonensis]|uniref:Alginate export domain-containing protein n=1 Tax=Limimaricola pyoseonensis TaxID=521013 RepID=A0A1G7KJZ1_9RHOB|nr:hypothetical protein [Limimaricola pyoseonensis]SDF37512.1 hypothetical protein SAMN04488567_0231 [Limimaricola pyoseonensis]